ncbi:MAG: HDOD domain-containing protein [Sideroxydans sp.]|nr:HDOD domain-containing protein [Sideroxydans sp.]
MIRGKIDFKSVPVQAGVISDIINLDIESSDYFQRLDDLIGADQGVASLVLRVVNSPLYSRGNKVATIPLAISLLGYSVLRSLALLAFSRSLFSETRHEAFRLHIWQHSLLAAIASQRICLGLGEARNGDEAFIAGLMHDIGKVLMFTQHPDLYQQVFEHMLATGCTAAQAEQKYFGFDHYQVGADAVKAWHLPDRFNAYMGVELTQSEGADAILTSLMAANALLKSAGIGAGEAEAPDARRARLRAFGLDDALCDSLLQEDFIDSLRESEIYKLCMST